MNLWDGQWLKTLACTTTTKLSNKLFLTHLWWNYIGVKVKATSLGMYCNGTVQAINGVFTLSETENDFCSETDEMAKSSQSDW